MADLTPAIKVDMKDCFHTSVKSSSSLFLEFLSEIFSVAFSSIQEDSSAKNYLFVYIESPVSEQRLTGCLQTRQTLLMRRQQV